MLDFEEIYNETMNYELSDKEKEYISCLLQLFVAKEALNEHKITGLFYDMEELLKEGQRFEKTNQCRSYTFCAV